MSRFIDGFESGDFQYPPWNIPSTSTTSVVGYAPIVGGNYCMQIPNTDWARFDTEYITGTGNCREFYFKIRVRHSHVYTSNQKMMRFRSKRNYFICEFGFGAGPKFRVFPAFNNYGTYFESTNNIPNGEWYIFELYWYTSTDNYTADGIVDLRINGVQEINEVNVVNNQSRDSFGDEAEQSVRYIEFGHSGNSNSRYIDDFVFDSTATFGLATNSSILGYRPSSGPGYENVDETGDVNTVDNTYNSTNVLGAQALCGLTQDATGTISAVHSVQTDIRTRRTGFTTPTRAKPVVKTGGTVYDKGSEQVGHKFRAQHTNWRTNPDTGVDWTEPDVQALEAGVETDR